VAYEMLTGHPPFAGRSPQAVMAAHANQAPQPVAERRPGVPAPLARIVMKCLEKRPADRPQSAREIARVVSAMRPSGPTELRGPLWTRAAPWVPWAVAATMTVVAVVAAVIAMRCRC
jgi:serine/threonine protein kinase